MTPVCYAHQPRGIRGQLANQLIWALWAAAITRFGYTTAETIA
jgi:hypothetical protein